MCMVWHNGRSLTNSLIVSDFPPPKFSHIWYYNSDLLRRYLLWFLVLKEDVTSSRNRRWAIRWSERDGSVSRCRYWRAVTVTTGLCWAVSMIGYNCVFASHDVSLLCSSGVADLVQGWYGEFFLHLYCTNTYHISHTWENFGRGKIGKFGELYQIFPHQYSQIHRKCICTDCSLFKITINISAYMVLS